MKHISLILGLSLPLFIASCSSNNKPCEEILEVKQQNKLCQDLKKTMQNKEYPQIALTARKRFEEACVDLRYYRDDFDTICRGDQRPIGKLPKKAKY